MIKLKEIRHQYPSLALCGDDWMVEVYKNIQKDQMIFEFVSRTIPPEKTIIQLKNRFKLLFNLVKIIKNNIFILFDPVDIDDLEDVNKFMDSFGWYPSKFDMGYGGYKLGTAKQIAKKNNLFGIYYESKYDVEIDKNTLGRYLYHVTPDFHIESIELIGLTPRSKSKISNHPERIYLLKTKKKIQWLVSLLYSTLTDKQKSIIKSYFLLEIDTHKLNKDFRFFNDPQYNIEGGAVWTFENIPPVAIKQIQEIEVK